MHGIAGMKGWKTRGRGLAMAAALALGATLAQGAALAQNAQQSQPGPKTAPSPVASAHDKAAIIAAMDKMARFKHARLTVEKAKAAMEVFLKLRETFPPEFFRSKKPGPEGPVKALKSSEKAREILALVKKKGFSSIDDWANTFTSLGMAIAHVREGGDATVEKKLKDVAGSSLPEEIKEKIAAMLKAVTPPRTNAEVAKRLLADEEAKRLIEAVERTAREPARK